MTMVNAQAGFPLVGFRRLPADCTTAALRGEHCCEAVRRQPEHAQHAPYFRLLFEACLAVTLYALTFLPISVEAAEGLGLPARLAYLRFLNHEYQSRETAGKV